MALRQINMIPSDLLVKTTLIRHVLFWAKGLMGVGFCFVSIFLAQGYLYTRQQLAHDSNTSMNQGVSEEIDSVIQASDTVRDQMAKLELKGGMVAILAEQVPFYDILAVLADSFNDATWIDRLSIQRGGEKDRDRAAITVEGFTMTHQTLGFLLESLTSLSRVQNMVLISAKNNDQASSDLGLNQIIRFKFSCSIGKGPSQ